MGLAYGLAAGTCWNSLIYLVKGQRIGTVMGISSGVLNVGCMVTPIVMGYLIDQKGGFYSTICCLSLSLAVCALVVASIVHFIDLNTTKVLKMNVTDRNQFYE